MKGRLWKSMVFMLFVLSMAGAGSFAENSNQGGEADSGERDRLAENSFFYEYIYFKADSTTVLPGSHETLDQKAEWLKQNVEVPVIIEGHCDERGSAAFNMKLGEARAGMVKTYLIGRGVPASQLLTISYGEEDPVDTGHTEESWAKNRRVRFVPAYP